MGSRLPVPHLKRRGRLAAGGWGRSFGAWIALVALVGSLSLEAHAAPLKPKSSKARQHFDAAVERYNAEDYDGAAAEANAGLAIEEHESLLFILGQAERLRGNCVEAVEIFNRFIDMTQSDDMRQNALTAKALCAEELAEIARQAEIERRAAEAAAEQADDEPPPPTLPPPEPPQPWYRDPLGGALVGVGGAAVLAGGAVLITAAVLDPSAADDYGTFADRRRLRPKLLLAGGLTAGIGALVGAGGAVRWALLAKKQKQEKAVPADARLRVGPWLDRQNAGVVLTGRF